MSDTVVRDDQLPAGAGDAAEVIPRPAASTLLLRGDPFEVLLMRRHEKSSFVPGAWVFPGGTLDREDIELGSELSAQGQAEETTLRLCALRELFEEAGVWLGPPLAEADSLRKRLLAGDATIREVVGQSAPYIDRLVLTARWITPVGVPKRFDTWFFIVDTEPETEATPELSEGTELLWITPAAALERHRIGELTMVFPTMKNLEAIARFSSSKELISSRRVATVSVTRPVLVVDGGKKRIILRDDQPC